jgi:hypothetical protein
VAKPFASVPPTIDLTTSGIIPLGHLILWLICFGFASGSGFEFTGAALFAPLAKGAGFDVAFPSNATPPKRPVYPPTHTLRRAGPPTLRRRFGGQARLPENWSHGQSNFASRCAMLRMEKFQMTRVTRPVGDLLHSGGQLASPLKSAGSEQKANRNTCQFRNRCNTLTTNDVTFF